MLAVLAAVVLAAVGGADAAAESSEASAKGRYHALFNFGDSLADAGNLIQNGTPDILATARLPYGQTYFGRATGRCSDGRLVIDHLGTVSLAFGVASASSARRRFGVPDGFPGLPCLQHKSLACRCCRRPRPRTPASRTAPISPSPAPPRSTRPTSRPRGSVPSSGTPERS
jgi:hypothetical protein